jgi:hypothetical protein
MDPYLERHWSDVHTRLVTYAADTLNGRLPEDLIASTEERVAVESDDDEDDDGEAHGFKPDVRVVEPAGAANPATYPTSSPMGVAIAAPYKLVIDLDPTTERLIRIIEAGTERLVTVIEVVSPTNKRGAGLREFRRKRRELLSSGVNVVEVDLVRAGDWVALMAPHLCPRSAAAAYRVTLRLPTEGRAAYLFPAPIRQRLPEVQIPLRPKDPAVHLDLQELIDRVYEIGRYGRRIDYRGEPDPPLDEADAAWADALLKAAGRR